VNVDPAASVTTSVIEEERSLAVHEFVHMLGFTFPPRPGALRAARVPRTLWVPTVAVLIDT
jgi:hypothetical protein